MKKLIIYIIMAVLLVYSAIAVCTVTVPNDNYLPGSTIPLTAVCDSAAETSKAYSINWWNGTHIVETDTGTTPTDVNIPFFETLVTPATANWTASYVNMTGTNLEGIDYFNVTGNNSRLILIGDSKFTPQAFIGVDFAVDFQVTDINGLKLDNADCLVYGTDNNSAPLQVCGEVKTRFGRSVCEDKLNQNFKEATPYLAKIYCSCGVGDNKCSDENGNDIEAYYGETEVPFITSKWLTVNTVTDKNNYTEREEVFVCANITNVDSTKRVITDIYHQIRCSNKADNNADTDRALIASDDDLPDQRGISPNTTQMQCKRFIVNEADYLQGGTNECYASSTVFVLDDNNNEVISYVTQSPKFNVTFDDININPDWERHRDNVFNTIINLNESRYVNFNAQGVGNIDLRLQRGHPETVKPDEQYEKHALSFESFLRVNNIKNITVVNNTGGFNNWAIEVNDDGNIEIELRKVLLNTSAWYNVTIEFENFEERSVIAQENSSVALEGINNKTGVFYFEIFTPNICYIGQDCTITIINTPEPIGSFSGEVQFQCYIIDDNGNQVSYQKWNKWVDESGITQTRNIYVPDNVFTPNQYYNFKCVSDYFNFGSIHQESQKSVNINYEGMSKPILEEKKFSISEALKSGKDIINRFKLLPGVVQVGAYIVLILTISTLLIFIFEKNK